MRVLVTGAAGFVGSRVARAALDRGHETIGLVRPHGRTVGVGPGLRLEAADLCDPEMMRRVAREAVPDVAIHLAWSIGSDCYDAPDNLDCVGGSLALLQGLLEAGCKRIVFAGTHLELAPGEGDLDENHPVAPRDLYSVCKDALHRVARTRTANAGASFVWARLFNVYGPAQPQWSLVPHVIRHLLDGRRCPMTYGGQERSFLHVAEVADALLAVGESTVEGVVHVGSDEAVTIADVARRIGRQLGREDLLAFGELEPNDRDAPRIVPCVERLRSVVGFRPKRTLDEGLSDTIDWFRRQHREIGAGG